MEFAKTRNPDRALVKVCSTVADAHRGDAAQKLTLSIGGVLEVTSGLSVKWLSAGRGHGCPWSKAIIAKPEARFDPTLELLGCLYREFDSTHARHCNANPLRGLQDGLAQSAL